MSISKILYLVLFFFYFFFNKTKQNQLPLLKEFEVHRETTNISCTSLISRHEIKMEFVSKIWMNRIIENFFICLIEVPSLAKKSATARIEFTVAEADDCSEAVMDFLQPVKTRNKEICISRSIATFKPILRA